MRFLLSISAGLLLLCVVATASAIVTGESPITLLSSAILASTGRGLFRLQR